MSDVCAGIQCEKLTLRCYLPEAVSPLRSYNSVRSYREL